MIRYVKGDFFDYDADIRVNTVNCVGVMGAGVALAFKKRFPEMFSDYAKACKESRVKPGKPHVWQKLGMFENELTIINLPTKEHWRNPSKYEYIEKGLHWLRQYLRDKPGSTVTLPALGCGHGGLDWEKVKLLIEEYLKGINSKILVFEPKSSQIDPSPSAIKERLLEQGVNSLHPSDDFYPYKMKGRSATTIYVKGPVDQFNSKILALVIDPKSDEREKNAILKCIDGLSSKGIVFAVGFSSKIEKDIVRTLMEKGEKTILFPAEGMLRLKIRKDIASILDPEKTTIVSIEKPEQSWQPHQNIKSFKFRIQNSDFILVTNRNLSKLERFKEEFRSDIPLFYLKYGTENPPFIEGLGAKGIGRDRNSLMPNLNPIIDTL